MILITGKTGGQTVIGGIASGENLTFIFNFERN